MTASPAREKRRRDEIIRLSASIAEIRASMKQVEREERALNAKLDALLSGAEVPTDPASGTAIDAVLEAVRRSDRRISPAGVQALLGWGEDRIPTIRTCLHRLERAGKIVRVRHGYYLRKG